MRSYLWRVHAMFGKAFSQFLSIFLPSITAVIQRNAFLPLLVKIIYWQNLVFILIFTLELIHRALSTGPGPTAVAACNIGRDISPDQQEQSVLGPGHSDIALHQQESHVRIELFPSNQVIATIGLSDSARLCSINSRNWWLGFFPYSIVTCEK